MVESGNRFEAIRDWLPLRWALYILVAIKVDNSISVEDYQFHSGALDLCVVLLRVEL